MTACHLHFLLCCLLVSPWLAVFALGNTFENSWIRLQRHKDIAYQCQSIQAAGLNVEFDLIFEDKGLSRIITYVYHPSAVYFENPNGPRSCSVQIEAASSF